MEQNTLWVNKEPTLAHKINEQKGSVVILLAAIFISYILAVFMARFWNGTAFVMVLPVLFLAIGLLHVSRLSADFQALTTTQKWIYTLIISFTIALLFGIASFWGIRFSLLTIVAAPVAFLLPFLLSELSQSYMQMFGTAKHWQLTTEATKSYPDVYLNGMPLRFKIATVENENLFFQTEFRTLAEMPLGDVFYDMVQKHNRKSSEAVALIASDGQPFQWTFSTAGFLGMSRILNPALSLSDNGLKKDSTIHALRLATDNNLLLHNQNETKELNFIR